MRKCCVSQCIQIRSHTTHSLSKYNGCEAEASSVCHSYAFTVLSLSPSSVETECRGVGRLCNVSRLMKLYYIVCCVCIQIHELQRWTLKMLRTLRNMFDIFGRKIFHLNSAQPYLKSNSNLCNNKLMLFLSSALQMHDCLRSCLGVCAFLKAWNSRVECATNLKIAIMWTGCALRFVWHCKCFHFSSLSYQFSQIMRERNKLRAWEMATRQTAYTCTYFQMKQSKAKVKKWKYPKRKIKDRQQLKHFQLIRDRVPNSLWSVKCLSGWVTKCKYAVCWSDSSRIRSVAIDDISRVASCDQKKS